MLGNVSEVLFSKSFFNSFYSFLFFYFVLEVNGPPVLAGGPSGLLTCQALRLCDPPNVDLLVFLYAYAPFVPWCMCPCCMYHDAMHISMMHPSIMRVYMMHAHMVHAFMLHVLMMHVSMVYVLIMNVSLMRCIYPWCLYPWCLYPWYMYPRCMSPRCIVHGVFIHDVCIHHAYIHHACVHDVCIHDWCIPIHLFMLRVSRMHVSMMHISIIQDPDACNVWTMYIGINDPCSFILTLECLMYVCVMNIVMIFNFDLDIHIHDAWCMHLWCMYQWWMYPWCDAYMLHASMILDPDTCVYDVRMYNAYIWPWWCISMMGVLWMDRGEGGEEGLWLQFFKVRICFAPTKGGNSGLVIVFSLVDFLSIANESL